ncbi:MAG: hypothetical protein R3249_08345, partial [Nitriliruptorales bacterium]|nr:hypothetical protein [Nitriliruptorales bacterium]
MRRLVAAVLLLAACTPGPASVETPTPSPADTTSPSAAPDPLVADVVFHNGTVITMDAGFHVATGLAILADRIVAVGDGEELRQRAPDALHLDLEGQALLPGIIDPHIHLEQNESPDVENMLATEEMLLESGRTTLGVPAIIPINLEGYDAIE